MSRQALIIGEMRRATGGGQLARRRRRRRSRRWLALQICGGVALLAALALTGRWFVASDTFAIGRVKSGAYRYTDQDDLQQVFAAWLGANIWSLSGGEINAALTALPWIRAAEIKRQLPNTIEIGLQEWRPLVTVAVSDATEAQTQDRVLIGDGRVLPVPRKLANPGLPVLVGVKVETMADGVGWRLAPEQSEAVLALIAAMEDVGLENARPVDFLVARPEGFAIVLQGDAGRLLVGKDDFYERLERYLSARDHIPAGVEIDLRFRERVTYRSAQKELP